jgi:hypothetical protein
MNISHILKPFSSRYNIRRALLPGIFEMHFHPGHYPFDGSNPFILSNAYTERLKNIIVKISNLNE